MFVFAIYMQNLLLWTKELQILGMYLSNRRQEMTRGKRFAEWKRLECFFTHEPLLEWSKNIREAFCCQKTNIILKSLSFHKTRMPKEFCVLILIPFVVRSSFLHVKNVINIALSFNLSAKSYNFFCKPINGSDYGSGLKFITH